MLCIKCSDSRAGGDGENRFPHHHSIHDDLVAGLEVVDCKLVFGGNAFL